MKYLLSTDVLFEMTRANPNKNVAKWFASVSDTDMFISVASIGEIIKRIEKLSDAAAKAKLAAWFDGVIAEGFDGRIIGLDADVMRVWARLGGERPILDGLCAATAIANGLTLVGRIEGIDGASVFNPWENGGGE